MVFRQLLSALIRGEASRRLFGAAQAAAGAMQSPAALPAAKPKRPRIAILFALGIEAAAMQQALKGAEAFRGDAMHGWFGDLGTRRVILAIGGAGSKAISRAVRELLSVGRPEQLISAGFAGGLCGEMARGDLLLADRVLRPDPEGLQSISLPSPVRLAPRPRGPILRRGALVTVDSILRTPREKKACGETTGALACDLETWTVAEACRETGTPLHALRIISDAVEEELPKEVAHLMQQKSAAGQVGAVLGSLFRRPAAAQDLWKLKQQAQSLSQQLAPFLAELVQNLES